MSSPSIGVRKRFLPNNPKLDWAHPLAQDLEFCGVSALALDLAKGRVASVESNNQNSIYGPTRRVFWSNNETIDLEFVSGPYTVATAGILSANSTYYAPMQRSAYVSESNNQGWELQSRPSSDPIRGLAFVTMRNNSNNLYTMATGTLASVGSYIQLARSNGVNLRELFVNGLKVATSTTSINPLSSSGPLYLGSPSSGYMATIGFAWSRSLSDNEIAMFTADPYCMLSY